MAAEADDGLARYSLVRCWAFYNYRCGVWAVYWSTDSGLNAKFDAMHRELGEVSRQLTSIEDQLAIIAVELTAIGNGIRELLQDADERKDYR